MLQSTTSRVQFPDKAMALFKPAPYKVMKGGRGGAKSWSFARALLILGTTRKLFIVCARDIQKSIKESVHKLMSDQVVELGFHAHTDSNGVYHPALYDIQEYEIIGSNGTRIVFVGVRNNIMAIKSMEAIDIFAVFEANPVPMTSWEVLLPTVRGDPPRGPFGEGSEMWIEFNPELSKDPTYQLWVENPPEGTVLIDINWNDNKWFPERLRKLKDQMKLSDPDSYRTVWMGQTRRTLTGAIYTKELEKAINDGRINPNVRYIKGKGVIVAFDLGDEDMCSMWAIQQIGTEHNLVNFYENCGEDIEHYLQQIKSWGYAVRGIWLPHDATQKHQSARRMTNNTIEKQVRAIYPTEGVVRVMPRTPNHATKINALRMLFPRLVFNETTCEVGLHALTHYQFGVHPETKKRTKEPLHNWASHASSALGDYALTLREGKSEDDEINNMADIEWPSRLGSGVSQGWMN